MTFSFNGVGTGLPVQARRPLFTSMSLPNADCHKKEGKLRKYANSCRGELVINNIPCWPLQLIPIPWFLISYFAWSITSQIEHFRACNWYQPTKEYRQGEPISLTYVEMSSVLWIGTLKRIVVPFQLLLKTGTRRSTTSYIRIDGSKYLNQNIWWRQ